MCALLLDDLFPVLRVGLYLRFSEWQRAEFFLGECLGLVLGIVGRGVAGLGEREHAQCVRPQVVEADDLQVTAAADHFAFAIGPWHGLHGVIDAERLRAAVDGGLPGDLDIAPAAVGAETEPGDFSSRGQHGFAQGLGNVGAVDGEATGGGQWFGRVESHAPGIGGLLPDKNNISKFFKKNIYPWLVELTKLPGLRDKFEYKQGRTHIILTYHPDTHNGSGSYTSYDVAASRGKNPLYNALKGKKNQLRGAPIDALRLVIVCDGDCSLLRRGSSLMTGETYSSTQVTKDFLRLNSSIDAVLLVTIDEHRAFLAHKVTCSLKYELVTADSYQKSPRLTEQSVKAIYDLLDGAIKTMPTPLRSAYSAAALCLRSEIGPDRIGGYTLQGNDITISSRALQRLLAGEISSEEFIRQHRWDGDEPNPFDRTFKFGQLISAVKVVNGKDLDDDSLTFSFGWPDPAASPFIVMTSQDED